MKSQGNSEPSTSQPAPGNASKALPVARTCREGEIIPRLQTAVFLGLYFICLWRWIDVRLIYHGGGEVRGFPSFYFGWDFARDFLRYPGGLTEYLSALASQSLFYSWCGALVLTLQAWLILACTQSLLNSLGARRFSLTAFAAPVLDDNAHVGANHARDLDRIVAGMPIDEHDLIDRHG